ncbi:MULTISPECIES: accessory Sec system protein Asp1 [Aerococcus]|uniref:Accessory Sec system protein Asp1 n=2 Tax=Aerococcus TaxID=1375 RepID=A0A178HH21_9LACT|nr:MULTISPECIES: accessory Sec system protein Asp1 [Aerococcus]MCY3026099.1 accessory Sec system protein Asp1 [Aerococcus loyolae]MCY3028036.1 accessory Sec system protein Asp1 [Aerococcus loyolae]MCY3029358.1 accessory Sec system protein Asp1 [Aerococcus loyolae]MDK6728642.1 accessory Sec system protein Asp1 [Aerococcus urinae]MDK7909789.1 accessory Sec system protein Asp1 [Aerococcus urinae]
MYYFIPSWYANNQWDFVEPSYMDLYFDDTVNQLRLFQRAGEANQLLMLDYAPMLRLNLHDQNIEEYNYWSVFDFIQGINLHKVRPITLEDLSFPKQAEFVPTPFLMMVFVHNEHYADIQFKSNGYIAFIDYYQDKQLTKQYIFDDRAFISSVIFYNNGQASHQDYLNLAGQWVVREFYAKGSIEINQDLLEKERFDHTTYQSKETLIEEMTSKYLIKHMGQDDKVVVAYSDRHNHLFNQLSQKNKIDLIYSLYSQRSFESNTKDFKTSLKRAKLLITDTDQLKDQLINYTKKSSLDTSIYRLSPFDTRLQLGMSQRIKNLIIYLEVSQLSLEEIKEVMDVIKTKMEKDERIRLVLGAFQIDQAKIDHLESLSDHLNKYFDSQYGEVVDFADKMPEKEKKPVCQVQINHSERDFIQSLKYVRLMIDWTSHPWVYGQIAGISAGISQINRVESAYVEHLKNGLIAKNLDQLAQGIDYYFKGLKHWNEALVYSVEKINKYHSGELVSQWKALLGENGND